MLREISHISSYLGALLTALLLLFLSSPSFASSGITYHGRLMNPNGTPVTSSNVQFRLQIRTPGTQDCLLYEEIQSQDLSTTKGMFSLSLGDGTGVRQDSYAADWTLFDSLSNRKAFNFNVADCAGPTLYTPSPEDNRKFRVFFNDGSFAGWEALPTQTINFIPMSIESYAVGGFPSRSLLRFEDASGNLINTSPLNNAQYTELLNLLAGTSSQYERAGRLNGVTLPALGNGESVRWDGSAWQTFTPIESGSETDPTVEAFAKSSLPTCGVGEVLSSDGTSFSCVNDATGGTPSDATTSSKGIVQIGDGISVTTGIISLPDVVANGTYTKVTVDDKGRVVTGDNIDGDDITSGTIGGSTSINSSGNIHLSGASSKVTSNYIDTRRITLFDDQGTPGEILLRAPATVSPNYTLTFPVNDGDPGQVLSTDGDGILSWISPSSGSVTSVSGTAPISVDNTNPATPIVSLSDSGVVATTYGSSTEVPVFAVDAKGRITSVTNTAITGTSPVGSALSNANIWVGDAGNLAVARPVSGDASITNLGEFTVTKIQGTSVSSSPPTAQGQVLKYNGTTEYVATYFGVADLKNASGSAQFPGSCTSAQTLTYSSITDVYTCSNISIANTQISGLGTASTKDFGTSAGNLVELDGSNRIPSSLLPTGGYDSTYFKQDGNSFGNTATLGTNDNHPLSFETNSTTRMTILANGNVGIGTATPGAKLHIYETTTATNMARFRNNADGADIVFTSTALNTPLIQAGDMDSLGFAVANSTTPSLFINSSGLIGIGTTTPYAKLEVSGGVKIGNETTCDSNREGTQRYNSTLKIMEFCNGTTWTSMGGGGITECQVCARHRYYYGGHSWTAESCSSYSSGDTKRTVSRVADGAGSGLEVSIQCR